MTEPAPESDSPFKDLPELDREGTLTEATEGAEATSAGDPQLFRPNAIDDPDLTSDDVTTGGDGDGEEPDPGP